MPAELVTQTEFARRVGVSRQRVGQLLDDGRLPIDQRTRRIPWAEGLAAWSADRGIEAPATGSAMTEAEALEIVRRDPPALHAPGADSAADSAANVAAQHAKARAADKVWQAKTRELRYQTLRGTLVERADVDTDSENVAALIRSTLLAIPSKLAPQLSGRILETATVEQLLAAEIEAALAHLYESRYQQRSPKP
ncbi:MAG: hypothetical protein RBU45_25590 [Myxococcota bacterium]|jgi:phage terminase Nu1 subunit (DNA packaging protein)|nr:hypothetical protein [Myxococcota bacterium]